MKNAQKFVGFKDVVLVTLLTAVCIVISTVVVLPFSANIKLVLWFVSGIDLLLCGSVYMLMAAKAPRHGTLFIFSFLFAVYYFITNGMIIISLMITGIGVLQELLMIKGGYKSYIRLTASFALYGIGVLMAPVILIFFTWDQVLAALLANGLTQEYADSVLAVYSPLNIAIGITGTIIGAVLGCMIGYRMLNKHFKPAGLVESE